MAVSWWVSKFSSRAATSFRNGPITSWMRASSNVRWRICLRPSWGSGSRRKYKRGAVKPALAIRGDGVKSASDKLNYYAYSTIKAPDKGEVGGSSPPRPTNIIINKYAAILTFPLFGDLTQKTVLSTVCQLYDSPDGTTLRALRPFG